MTLEPSPSLQLLPHPANGGRWRISLGFLLQSLVVGLLLLAPLLFTDSLNGALRPSGPVYVPIAKGDPEGGGGTGTPHGPGGSPSKPGPVKIITFGPEFVQPIKGPVFKGTGTGEGTGPVDIPFGHPQGIPGGTGTMPVFTDMVLPARPPAPQEPVSVGGRIRQPRVIHQVKPAYPSLARKMGLEGTVVLEAVLEADGRVREITPVSGPALLVPAAVEAVRQWVYEPTYLNEQPVPVRMFIRVEFHLNR